MGRTDPRSLSQGHIVAETMISYSDLRSETSFELKIQSVTYCRQAALWSLNDEFRFHSVFLT